MVREIVIDQASARVLGAAQKWLIKETRRRGLENARHYQHRQIAQEDVPFMDVYSNDAARAGEARGLIGYVAAYEPESLACHALPERVNVLCDSNPQGNPGDRHIEGLVLLRQGQRAFRIRVALRLFIAQNGNENPVGEPVITVE